MAQPVSDTRISEYNQQSFLGGMDLLHDDSRLQANQYRLGFNLRNRYDTLDLIQSSVLDTHLPQGVIQELVTFGNYVIAFVSGSAYYRYYTDVGWTQIPQFSMSPAAPRYWTVAVPLATTLYGRLANAVSATITSANIRNGVATTNSTVAASTLQGNTPGLLVQDNINQPQFIFLNANGVPTCRTTQTYTQWNVTYDETTFQLTVDGREYVPIGNAMAWVDGILYIASPDTNSIYRSVSGRPLDFVVNVTTSGKAGGDATTTSYSVGVGGISALRSMPDGSLFVAASNSNFSVSKNMTQNAVTEWGEYTFIRKFLFESTCLSDRCIIDSLGDTRFIDLTGVRSFNAISQLFNEGRNSPFTATIQRAFSGIVQDVAAAIYYDNYELYGVNTIFGPAIAVYDTINNAWSSFDMSQTNGHKIKILAKIELAVQALFAVTDDNKLYTLYSSTSKDAAMIMTNAISANMLYANQNIRENNPKNEVKPIDFRAIVNRIDSSGSIVTLTAVVNNRVSATINNVTKTVTYAQPVTTYTGNIPDINTQLTNMYFQLADCEQGWKVSYLLSWTVGSITQFACSFKDLTPMVPLLSQGTVV